MVTLENRPPLHSQASTQASKLQRCRCRWRWLSPNSEKPCSQPWHNWMTLWTTLVICFQRGWIFLSCGVSINRTSQESGKLWVTMKLVLISNLSYNVTGFISYFINKTTKTTSIYLIFLFWIQELNWNHLNNFHLNKNAWSKSWTFRRTNPLEAPLQKVNK